MLVHARKCEKRVRMGIGSEQILLVYEWKRARVPTHVEQQKENFPVRADGIIEGIIRHLIRVACLSKNTTSGGSAPRIFILPDTWGLTVDHWAERYRIEKPERTSLADSACVFLKGTNNKQFVAADARKYALSLEMLRYCGVAMLRCCDFPRRKRCQVGEGAIYKNKILRFPAPI